MNITIIGATGFVGQHLVNEALQRGHHVTAIARNTSKLNASGDNLTRKDVDINDTEALAAAVAGSDAVVSAFNPGWDNPNIYHDFLNGAKAIQTGVKKSGVKRYITVGGAGSLYTPDGVQLVDTPEFPPHIYPGASAARDYYDYLKPETELEWTFVSPAIEMHPGITLGRTGQYRTGLEQPVFDENNRSVLSGEDLAVAIIDEAEQNNHIRGRFTAAY